MEASEQFQQCDQTWDYMKHQERDGPSRPREGTSAPAPSRRDATRATTTTETQGNTCPEYRCLKDRMP